jgi:hypothetical protein
MHNGLHFIATTAMCAGSFGDNELSPECLDGAQRFLKEGGISIPSAYTSFLSPVMSSKLWNEVKVRDSLPLTLIYSSATSLLLQAYKEPKWFETPFVVKLFNFHELATPQPVFTFVHPNKADPIDNRRYVSLEVFQPHVAQRCLSFLQVCEFEIYKQCIRCGARIRGLF